MSKSEEAKDDTVAILVAMAGDDVEGAVALMEQMDIDPESRVAHLIAGMAGYGIGVTMRLLIKVGGVPEDAARMAARATIIDWFMDQEA